jgi:hypothetical protein
MPCSRCGKGTDPAFLTGAIQHSSPVLDENDLFALSSAPECTEPYHGQFLGASVIVVGRGTDKEKLFRKGDRLEASKMARQQNLTYDHVLAKHLCHELVVDLLRA